MENKKGKTEMARELYEKVLQLEPNNSDAWHLLGLLLADLKMLAKAQTSIKKAMKYWVQKKLVLVKYFQNLYNNS